MIHVLIGTKGQLIKMAPIMKEMDQRNIEYNYINAGQHTKILDEVNKLFDLKNYDYNFENVGRDVANIKDMLIWIYKNLKHVFSKNNLFNRGDLIIVHGDAPPALMGLILGKLKRLKIMHVEAGERTHKILEPFPEELIRVIVDRYSDYQFASSDESYSNLVKEGVKEKIFNVKINTIFDAVRIAVNSVKYNSFAPHEKYVLASIHRYENISSKERMEIITNTIEKASKQFKIIFPLHESTRHKLDSLKLIKRLEDNPNIKTMPLQNYFSFIKLINGSEYLITDGGGPQQESYFLNKPCLLMRTHTERMGYPNICLSKFDEKIINDFVDNYSKKRHNIDFSKLESPSKKIVDVLKQNLR